MTGEVTLTYKNDQDVQLSVKAQKGEVPGELAILCLPRGMNAAKNRRALAALIGESEQEVHKWFSELVSVKGGSITHPVKIKDPKKQPKKLYRLERDGKGVGANTAAECVRKAIGLAGSTVTAPSDDFCFLVVTAADGSPLSAESLAALMSKTKIEVSPLYYTANGSVVNFVFCEASGCPAKKVARGFRLLAEIDCAGIKAEEVQSLHIAKGEPLLSPNVIPGRVSLRDYLGFGAEDAHDTPCPSLNLAALVRGKTHWHPQAESVLWNEVRTLPKAVLKDGYHCLIGLARGVGTYAFRTVVDPNVGGSVARTRFGNVNPSDGTVHQECRCQIRPLAAVCDDNGKVDGAKLELHVGRSDLSAMGYPFLTPFTGLSPYYIHQKSKGDVIPLWVSTSQYLGNYAKFAPRYLPPGHKDRLPRDEAYGVLTETLTGLPPNLLDLCLVQKAYADGGLDTNILLWLIGASGTGKDVMPKLSGSVLGTTCRSIRYRPDHKTLQTEIKDGMFGGGYIVLSEMFKAAKASHSRAADAASFLLSLDPQASVWNLFVGGKPLGRMPPIVICDSFMPEEVSGDIQIARRSVAVRLNLYHDWRSRCVEAGFDSVENYRTSSPQAARVCDSILSSVADRYFLKPRPWNEVVQELGFEPMTRMAYDKPKRFLLEYLHSEEATPNQLSKDGAGTGARGSGWRLIRVNDDTELAALWRNLSDVPAGGRWVDSTKMHALDWNTILKGERDAWKLPEGEIRVEFKACQNAVLVRFNRVNPSGESVPLEQIEN